MDITQFVALSLVSAAAAIVGSMLGLGGGVFLVPIFTLFFGIDQKLAIGASAIAVVTNSVVGSSVHLRSSFTNIRLAMLLQVTMAAGATIGAIVGVWAPERAINVVFGLVLLYAASSMLLKRTEHSADLNGGGTDEWELRASYLDPATKLWVTYTLSRVKSGLGIAALAGGISGMLGVGGGIIQVPTMNLLMRVPVKAAVGTSSFMVGITTVTTALVYYADSKIDPRIVIPTMIGIFVGSQTGSRLTRRIKAERLIMYFFVILLYLSFSLLLKAAGVTLPGQK